ncbi:MAG: hypothetical protein N2312_03075 [Dictyoglomaceae bacterium]|nr:hypothetical protein [Dictyoglomaceae bacterium]
MLTLPEGTFNLTFLAFTGGIKYNILQTISVFADLKYIYPITSEDGYSALSIGFGLLFSF